METMTQAEYARHRGVTRQAVSKAIKAGKIPVDGAGRINPADADFALGSNVARLNEPAASPPLAPAGEPTRRPVQADGLTKARTISEAYNARLMQLKYEQRVGKLVPTDQVVAATQACGEALLRVFESLPSRGEDIAAAAAAGLPELRVHLRGLARELRQQVSEELAKLPAAILAAGEAGEDREEPIEQ